MAFSLQTIVDQIETSLNDNTVTFRVGYKELWQIEGKRRVVWAWPGGQLGPPPFPGQQICGNASTNAIYQDLVNIHCHIVAEGLEAVEKLRNAVLRATRDAFAGVETGQKPGGYQVLTQQPQIAGESFAGMEYLIQTFVWDLRVWGEEDPDDLITVTTFDEVCELDPEL